MSIEFATKYKRIRQGGEKNSGKTITERAGYIPAKIQIENMINAGKRLSEYRKEMYDYADSTDIPEDIPMDPTRNPGFDMADASQISREVKKRILKAKEALESAKKEIVEKPKKEEVKDAKSGS